jgi:hypothetical protein
MRRLHVQPQLGRGAEHAAQASAVTGWVPRTTRSIRVRSLRPMALASAPGVSP